MATLSSHLLNSVNGTHASDVNVIIYQILIKTHFCLVLIEKENKQTNQKNQQQMIFC